MKILFAAVLAAGLSAGAAQAETRCGWVDNPTPGNWWLTDADGQWTLSTLGGDAAPGMENFPDMTVGEWVARNGSYGYGCACMLLVTRSADRKVLAIGWVRQLTLATCNADPKLAPRR
jgi:hypothetical protein